MSAITAYRFNQIIRVYQPLSQILHSLRLDDAESSDINGEDKYAWFRGKEAPLERPDIGMFDIWQDATDIMLCDTNSGVRAGVFVRRLHCRRPSANAAICPCRTIITDDASSGDSILTVAEAQSVGFRIGDVVTITHESTHHYGMIGRVGQSEIELTDDTIVPPDTTFPVNSTVCLYTWYEVLYARDVGEAGHHLSCPVKRLPVSP